MINSISKSIKIISILKTMDNLLEPDLDAQMEEIAHKRHDSLLSDLLTHNLEDGPPEESKETQDKKDGKEKVDSG